jgi:hypothetical protein
MKNSSDTIGNQTHDLPACSTMPQPTAPPCAPKTHKHVEKFKMVQSIESLEGSGYRIIFLHKHFLSSYYEEPDVKLKYMYVHIYQHTWISHILLMNAEVGDMTSVMSTKFHHAPWHTDPYISTAAFLKMLSQLSIKLFLLKLFIYEKYNLPWS